MGLLKVAAAGFGGRCVHQPSYGDSLKDCFPKPVFSVSLSLSSPAPYAPSECCYEHTKFALRLEALKSFYETSHDCLLQAIV